MHAIPAGLVNPETISRTCSGTVLHDMEKQNFRVPQFILQQYKVCVQKMPQRKMVKHILKATI